MKELKVKGLEIVRERIDKFRHDTNWSMIPRDHARFIRGEIRMLELLGIITADEAAGLRAEMVKAHEDLRAEVMARPIPDSIELDIQGNVVREVYSNK